MRDRRVSTSGLLIHEIHRPQFSGAERRELGAIGGEHETNHNPWKVASRFSWRFLEFVVSLDKCLWCEQFTVYSDRFSSFTWLPKETVRFKMEVRVCGGSGEFISDYRRQLAMVEGACIELFWPWIQHSFMKRDIDFDWGFDPVPNSVILHVLPTIFVQSFAVFPAQLGINSSPVLPSDVLRVKFGMSNDLNEILEAGLRFLFTIIPIPFS